MGLVLCFQMEPERKMRLAFVCAGMGLAFAEPQESALTIGELCAAGGLPPRSAGGAAPLLPVEMTVLYQLTDAQLDQFLQRWRQTGLSPIRLKAVVTPVNSGWTPAQLQAQLLAEDRSLHG